MLRLGRVSAASDVVDVVVLYIELPRAQNPSFIHAVESLTTRPLNLFSNTSQLYILDYSNLKEPVLPVLLSCPVDRLATRRRRPAVFRFRNIQIISHTRIQTHVSGPTLCGISHSAVLEACPSCHVGDKTRATLTMDIM
jgi:hypothetical protein